MNNGIDLRINIQTHNLEEAKSVTKNFGNLICVGVLARDFADLGEATRLVREMQSAGTLVSVGLGDGAADQWERALTIARRTLPFHLNQVFPSAALARRAMKDLLADTKVNALVSPTSDPMRLTVGTGPLSSKNPESSLPIPAVLDILLDGDISSVKLFPLRGTQNLETLKNVAVEVGRRDMSIEPTGGIDVGNLKEILEICLDNGCRTVMPHIYSSVKDEVGAVDFGKLDRAFEILEEVAG